MINRVIISGWLVFAIGYAIINMINATFDLTSIGTKAYYKKQLDLKFLRFEPSFRLYNFISLDIPKRREDS